MRIAEHFYSIQGEGPHTGVPAVFLRLSGCNLVCGGKGTIKDGRLHDGATWRCDTIEVWMKHKSVTIDELYETFVESGYITALERGAHLVVTGGEPLMQQTDLIQFLDRLAAHNQFAEIETNGTVLPEEQLAYRVRQFNVSPKLGNSGMPLDLRVNAEALIYFSQSNKSIFKFVVTSHQDLIEIEHTFIKPFAISPDKVQLMPGTDTRDTLVSLLPTVAELCKATGYRLSSRLHLEIWDKKTGV